MKTAEPTSKIGSILANFAVRIGYSVSDKKFNNAIDECVKEIYDYITEKEGEGNE